MNKAECCLQCGERSSPLRYLVGGRSRCPLCRLLGGLIRHGFAMGGEMFGDAPHADEPGDRQDREPRDRQDDPDHSGTRQHPVWLGRKPVGNMNRSILTSDNTVVRFVCPGGPGLVVGSSSEEHSPGKQASPTSRFRPNGPVARQERLARWAERDVLRGRLFSRATPFAGGTVGPSARWFLPRAPSR